MRFVGGVLFLLVFLVMIVPVMAADTFLLGSLSHWMWKYQVGTLAVVALSAAAIGILLWKDGKLTSEFSIKYLAFFAVLGAASIVVGWSQDYFGGVQRLGVEVAKGTTFIEPAASIKLKGGDHIVVKAFGRVTVGGKDYPPQGDTRRPIQFGDWYRPTGEMQILVWKAGQPAVEVPLENIKSGAETVGGFDLYHDVGYYIEAEATVSEKAFGYLDVGWFNLPAGQPDSGFVRLTIQVNPHLTAKGRLAKLPWYVSLLGILMFILAAEMGASYLAAVSTSRMWKATVWIAAILAVIYTVVALRQADAVDFEGMPGPDFSAMFEKGTLCPGNEIVFEKKGRTRVYEVGGRPGCIVSAVQAIDGSFERIWVFPNGTKGPKEVLSSRGPDLPGPSKRPSKIILKSLEDDSVVKVM